MSARRRAAQVLTGPDLDSALRTAGLRIGVGAALAEPPSLELVLVSAVAEALPVDYRLLSVATTWIGVHARRLHVSELARLLPIGEAACSDPARYRALWSAVARWQGKDSRWAKIEKNYGGKAVYLSHLGEDVAKLALEHKGEDARFAGSRLRVPCGLLRDRAADVDPPEVLAQRHAWYRERVRQGPTYRADCWAELQRDPAQTPAALAARVGCTYPVAHQAVQDWLLLKRAGPRTASQAA